MGHSKAKKRLSAYLRATGRAVHPRAFEAYIGSDRQARDNDVAGDAIERQLQEAIADDDRRRREAEAVRQELRAGLGLADPHPVHCARCHRPLPDAWTLDQPCPSALPATGVPFRSSCT